MHLGARLVIPGTLFGSAILAIFLYLVTAGASFPQPVLAAGPAVTPQPGGADNQSTPVPTEAVTNLVRSEESTAQTSSTVNTLDCGVSNLFPEDVRKWCGIIMEYADQRDLPPDLIAAVIWQESGGDDKAYSKSGAVGLMQVMPRDGKAASFMCVNGPCFTDRPTIAELEDPEFNIRYGTKLLASLINKYGSYRDALKNYGPRDVGYYYADIVLNLFEEYGN